MATFQDQLDLPFSQRQLFDLVADIEAYPRFIPVIAAARILRRTGDVWDVEQTVRLGFLRLTFRTQATLHKFDSLHVSGSDTRLGKFSEHWFFEALGPAQTRLRCQTRIEPHGPLLGRLAVNAAREIHHATLGAFVARAGALYGPVTSA